MKRLLLVAALLGLAACHFGEPLLPEPNADRDPRLLGVWHNPDSPDDVLTITADGAKRYRFAYDSGNKDPAAEYGQGKVNLAAYHADLPSGVRLLCVELKDAKAKALGLPPWLILGYAFDAEGGLTLRMLDEAALPEPHAESGYTKIPRKTVWEHLLKQTATPEGRARLFDPSSDLGPLTRKAARPAP
ncbi:MAG: hypothetical protein B9S34_03155 [Opitutia bacterium Tous-C1TDCM]|nr:MAG: hypothetical protein B9S34_03155 [Opitutae bacterium Tous-C1TDCM]